MNPDFNYNSLESLILAAEMSGQSVSALVLKQQG